MTKEPYAGGQSSALTPGPSALSLGTEHGPSAGEHPGTALPRFHQRSRPRVSPRASGPLSSVSCGALATTAKRTHTRAAGDPFVPSMSPPTAPEPPSSGRARPQRAAASLYPTRADPCLPANVDQASPTDREDERGAPGLVRSRASGLATPSTSPLLPLRPPPLRAATSRGSRQQRSANLLLRPSPLLIPACWRLPTRTTTPDTPV